MITVQEETFTLELAAEMEELVRDFFAKTEAGSNRPPLDYNWEYYQTTYDLGMFVVYVAREEGRMLGFAMYTLVNHPHHKTVKFGYCELIGTRFSERGRGVGTALLDYAENALREEGVSRMIQGDRYYHGRTPIFEKRPGYVLVERFYVKVLDEPTSSSSS